MQTNTYLYMKTNKEMSQLIQKQNIIVTEINKENNTFICSDGMEYPLMEYTDITVEELQTIIDETKNNFINLFLNGETA